MSTTSPTMDPGAKHTESPAKKSAFKEKDKGWSSKANATAAAKAAEEQGILSKTWQREIKAAKSAENKLKPHQKRTPLTKHSKPSLTTARRRLHKGVAALWP